jgi:translation initiation factor 2B subunit (eIF-2B alpha/beta/delta family)
VTADELPIELHQMNYGQANQIMREQQIKRQQAEGCSTGRIDVDQRPFDGAKQAGEISATQRSIESLEKDVAVLGEVLTMLSQRLAVVTRQTPICENKKEDLATICSPLVERINGIDKRIRQLTHALQLQLELLEI